MHGRAFTTLLAGIAALGLSACETFDDGYGPYGQEPGYGPPHAGYDYPGFDDRYGDPRHGQFGDYGYAGRDFDSRSLGPGHFRGPGARILDPWLAATPEGWAIVTTGFRGARQGWVDADTAHRVNIWFRRYADTNRDLRLTDPEIRVALVQASRDHGWMHRMPPPQRGW